MSQSDGTEDDSVERFKADLTAEFLRPPEARERTVRAIASRFDISSGTAGNLVKPEIRALPSRETVTLIVSREAPERLASWLVRREALEASKGRSSTPAAMPRPEQADRSWWTWSRFAVGVSGALVLLAAFVWLWSKDADLRQTEPEIQVVDGDDPQTAGCLEDATRVRTQPIGDLGFVSLVHSARCSAYWARVERVDGAEMSNHMRVSVQQIGSTRNPIVADEANAAIAYTYLVVDSTGKGNYCAEARVFVGESSEHGTACLRSRGQ